MDVVFPVLSRTETGGYKPILIYVPLVQKFSKQVAVLLMAFSLQKRCGTYSVNQ